MPAQFTAHRPPPDPQRLRLHAPGRRSCRPSCWPACCSAASPSPSGRRRRTYAPLFSNLAASDASAIVDKLNSAGVKYQLTDGGQTILVPQKDVYAERLKMSGEGLPVGQEHRLLAARPAGRDRLAVPAAGRLPARARGRAGQHDPVDRRRADRGRAPGHPAAGRLPRRHPEAQRLGPRRHRGRRAAEPAAGAEHRAPGLLEHRGHGRQPGHRWSTATATCSRRPATAPAPAAWPARTRDQQTSDYESGRPSQPCRPCSTGSSARATPSPRSPRPLDLDNTNTTTETMIAPDRVGPAAVATARPVETYGNGATAPAARPAFSARTTSRCPPAPRAPAPAASAATTTCKTSETADSPYGKITEQRKSTPGAVVKQSVAVVVDSAGQGRQPDQPAAGGQPPRPASTPRAATRSRSPAWPFDTTAAATAKKQLAAAASAKSRDQFFSMIKTAADRAAGPARPRRGVRDEPQARAAPSASCSSWR